MVQWLKDRWEILRLSLQYPVPFFVLAFFQMAAILLGYFPPPAWISPFLQWLTGIPWYGWAIGWLVVLWLLTLQYSVQRKKRFDETSLNFFKAYLDFVIKEGHQLFQFAGEKDFYSKIHEWQRKAVQGIAIGLGPEESKKFFQKVEAQNPLSEAYRQSAASKSDEPLARSLQAHLDELNLIRMGLPEVGEREPMSLQAAEQDKKEGVPLRNVELLPGKAEPPPLKQLPKK